MTKVSTERPSPSTLPGHDLSWAGLYPWTGTACYATEDGVLFLPTNMEENPFRIIPIFEDEAINGVAFSGNHIAISSRNKIKILPCGSFHLEDPADAFDIGAHGIVSVASGGFIAPLGKDGLLFLKPGVERPLIRHEGKFGQSDVNCYKVASLGDGPDGEVFVCAARSDGFFGMTIRDESLQPQVVGHSLAGIDIVDVCSISSPSMPRAAIALNRDASLLIIRDVLSPESPFSLRYEQPSGPAYSVLSAQGHVFILTKSELVTFPNLSRDFWNGTAIDRPRETFVLPMKSIDAFLLGDNQICAIAADEELTLSISDLVRPRDERPISIAPLLSRQDWEITRPEFVISTAA